MRAKRDEDVYKRQVVIYPYHGHLLEICRTTGLWPLFEDWKRKLTDLVATEGGSQAVLWDFSGYHQYAVERVPKRGDRTTAVRWYWEAGHFKSTLGHEVLQRMFGRDASDFGVILTPETIDEQLRSAHTAGDKYRTENAEALKDLQMLAH